jgi:O-antigen ligase
MTSSISCFNRPNYAIIFRQILPEKRNLRMKKILENLPFRLFCLLVFSLPFVNFPNLRNAGLPVQTTDILFVLTGFVWLIYLVLRKNKLRLSWFYLPLALYFFSLCLSTVFSENLKTSLIKLLGNLLLLGLAFLAFNLVTDEKRLRHIGIAWLAATLLVCLVSVFSLFLFYFQKDNPILLETLSHYGSLPSGNYPRIQSTFFNPNMLCNYLNISAGFLLVAFWLKWARWQILLVYSILFTITVLFTVSPGIGGVFLTVGLWLWLALKTVKPLYVKILSLGTVARLCLLGGILGAVFFFLTVLPSPTSFPAKLEPSPRVLTWISALETLQKYPFAGRGIGLDAGRVVYQSPNGEQILGDAHQLWLNVAAQQGIIGLAAIVFLTVWFIRRSLPFDLENNPLRNALGLAFIGAFCFQGLVGSYEDARHLWVLLGLLASAGENQDGINRDSRF